MRGQKNALLVRRDLEEVLEGGSLATIGDLLSPDVVMHLAGARQGVRGVAEAWIDFDTSVDAASSSPAA